MNISERAKWGVQGAALLALVMMQTACYDTYVIDKDELRKLESSVEQKEVVDVYGDCPAGSTSASRYKGLNGSHWAQAEGEAAATTTASDATSAAPAEEDTRAGCVKVPVSTANSLKVVGTDGEEYRVTPFNFIMSDSQLVSPEYDLLLGLNDVSSAEVKRFSTWKTVATIAGVTLATVGIFASIAVLAEDDPGFQN